MKIRSENHGNTTALVFRVVHMVVFIVTTEKNNLTNAAKLTVLV